VREKVRNGTSTCTICTRSGHPYDETLSKLPLYCIFRPPRLQVLVGVEYHQNILLTRTPAVRTDLFGKDPVRLWQLCCKLWKLVYLQYGGYLCSCQHRSFLAVTVYLNFPPHSRAFSTKLHCLITYFWTYFHSHRISGLHHPYSCRRGLRQKLCL
jgi:hypothetical protein